MIVMYAQAKQYLILKLDIEAKMAHARPTNVNYYTAARNRTDINVTKVIETATVTSIVTSIAINTNNNSSADSNSNSSSGNSSSVQQPSAAACSTSISTGCADVVHTVYGFYKKWLGNGGVSYCTYTFI
jgi:ATP-dependent helicase YprA (DUF1998 family)